MSLLTFQKTAAQQEPRLAEEKGEVNVPIQDPNHEKDEILVGWEGDHDPENPQNWSTRYKSWVTVQLSLLAFAASLASSITAPANRTLAEYLGVGQTVMVLNVSLYM